MEHDYPSTSSNFSMRDLPYNHHKVNYSAVRKYVAACMHMRPECSTEHVQVKHREVRNSCIGT